MRLFFFSVILTIFSCHFSIVKAQDSVFSYTHQGTTLYYTIDQMGDATLVPPLYPNIDTVNDEMWTGYTKPQGAVVIPDSVSFGGSNHAVTHVGYCAFFRCYDVTSVTMPSTLRAIDRHSFLDCSSLTSIVVPEGVTTIGFGAFDKCTSMQTITLPTTLTTIGEYAFYKCYDLQSVTLPESLTTIGAMAFSLSGLTEVVLPEGLTSLGEFAFDECYNLQSVSFPSTLSAISGACFQSDTSLVSVIIPFGVDTIHQWAFYDCKSLPTVTLPASLKYIGQDAFGFCTSLDDIICPDSIRYIGGLAFLYCSNLTTIHLPEQLERVNGWLLYGTAIEEIVVPSNVTFIDTSAFSACLQLHKVTLPASLTAIAEYLFDDGTVLDTIIMLCSTPPTAYDNDFTDYTATLIVPCGTESAYRQHAIWGQFQNIVENCNDIEDASTNNVKVYALDGRIIVEGADGEAVSVYDITGRQINHEQSLFDPGVYLVKVGTRPTQKVLIVR